MQVSHKNELQQTIEESKQELLDERRSKDQEVSVFQEENIELQKQLNLLRKDMENQGDADSDAHSSCIFQMEKLKLKQLEDQQSSSS